jgi:hypothetical protein
VAGHRDLRLALAATLAASGALLVAIAVRQPAWINRALGTLPGPNSAMSRLEIYAQVWWLAQATPFTGGGLAAFPALYATFSLGLPTLYLTHAHNAYLQVLIEQGWPGLAAYLAAVGAGAWAALGMWQRRTPREPLALAGLLGIAVVAVQGLADATLVASRAALVLLIPFGLALAVGAPAAASGAARRRRAAAGVLAVTVLALGTAVSRPGAAAWHTNLGVVDANRVLLADFPTSRWSTGEEAGRLAPAEARFQRALALDSEQPFAHQYLGLAAGLRRDFDTAVQHLRAAHAVLPGHRGIIKALAYDLVWAGDAAAAGPLLAGLREAHGEMTVYAWWWNTQGRPDLAARAQALLDDWPATPE